MGPRPATWRNLLEGVTLADLARDELPKEIAALTGDRHAKTVR